MASENYSTKEIIENFINDGFNDLVDEVNYTYSSRPLSPGDVPPWAKNTPTQPEQGKPIESFSFNPSINQNFDQSVTNIENKIYQTPTEIYQDNTFVTNTTTINNRIVEVVPPRPSSLLPIREGEESLSSDATSVTIGKPITLAQSINSQKFGKMLHNPFAAKKQIIRQAANTEIAPQLKELNSEGIARFAAYLDDEPKTNALDAIALLLPASLRATAGAMSMVFGLNTLRFYFANLTAASGNALIGVTDTIPSEYEIETYIPTAIKSSNNAKNFTLQHGSNGLDLGELTNNPIEWEKWLQEASTAQYGEKKDENNKVAVTNFTDFIRNVLAPFYFRLGLDKLPFVLPKNLIIDDSKEELETQITARQLTDYLLWQLTAFDSVMGQFPIKLQIDDTDLIKTGNQSLSLTFPNLSETISEIFVLMLSLKSNSDALLEIGLKNLGEAGQAKQLSVQNFYLASAIQEYLGFKTQQISKEIDFLFNPGVVAEEPENQTLSKALENSKLKIAIESNIDDDTLEKHIMPLLEAARIIKAVHFKPVDIRGNAKKAIIDSIKNSSLLADNLDFENNEKLKEFLDNIESGFAHKIPDKEINYPYGRDYSERPRIKHNINDVNNNNSEKSS
jgi:hypothetical protein